MNKNLVLVTQDLTQGVLYYQIKRRSKNYLGKYKYVISAIVKSDRPLTKAQVEMYRLNPEKLYEIGEDTNERTS